MFEEESKVHEEDPPSADEVTSISTKDDWLFSWHNLMIMKTN